MRGQDVVLLDLTKITPIADYFLIATGTSSRQMRATAGEVHRLFKTAGSNRIGLEGEGSNSWILQDFGDVVVHLFTQDAREAYDLEHLWGDAPRIDWKEELVNPSKPAKAPAKRSAKSKGTEGEVEKPAKPRTPRKKKKPSED